VFGEVKVDGEGAVKVVASDDGEGAGEVLRLLLKEQGDRRTGGSSVLWPVSNSFRLRAVLEGSTASSCTCACGGDDAGVSLSLWDVDEVEANSDNSSRGAEEESIAPSCCTCT